MNTTNKVVSFSSIVNILEIPPRNEKMTSMLFYSMEELTLFRQEARMESKAKKAIQRIKQQQQQQQVSGPEERAKRRFEAYLKQQQKQHDSEEQEVHCCRHKRRRTIPPKSNLQAVAA
mmetsp:Transcript_32010/g.73565  ORF Transcript_32010/g.73565 Transcript_32010/m.73565 type:complete len:118 (+) Transcript_32010:156-509(+)|eukprot:CAMPEP_0116857644 /NCGR_PEP_ID=MMETSP0418-20121206/20669_1 /TAXON_ID=1158023 /ORGANISM="Astrosyne radiata, Strain 13vi08-1A" /LENGTH=117 /DNA_ID=CAMNT_0004491353 /DNA_START=98 /DNA_END=451 /DNA_ORIENTATION=-